MGRKIMKQGTPAMDMLDKLPGPGTIRNRAKMGVRDFKSADLKGKAIRGAGAAVGATLGAGGAPIVMVATGTLGYKGGQYVDQKILK